MNFKFSGKTKTMGILLLAAVAVSSGTMAFAANGADVVHKNVLVSAVPVSTDGSKADFAKKIANNSGTIEYASKQPFGIKHSKHMFFAELKSFYLSAKLNS